MYNVYIIYIHINQEKNHYYNFFWLSLDKILFNFE